MKCLWCGNPSGRFKYCNVKCNLKDYYQKHKKERIDKATEWNLKNKKKRAEISKKSFKKFKEKNPDKIKEHARNQYRKNKTKANSRTYTWYLRNIGRIEIENICKHCGIKTKLEIHHEIYPTKEDGIRKAISEGKIYILCKSCHNKVKK